MYAYAYAYVYVYVCARGVLMCMCGAFLFWGGSEVLTKDYTTLYTTPGVLEFRKYRIGTALAPNKNTTRVDSSATLYTTLHCCHSVFLVFPLSVTTVLLSPLSLSSAYLTTYTTHYTP